MCFTRERPPSSCSRLRAGRAGAFCARAPGLGFVLDARQVASLPLASRWIAPSGFELDR
jgi:hypothetical protein